MMDISRLKQTAQGRWYEILPALTPISAESLTRRHGSPCPACGGTDRFFIHTDFDETGGVGCRHCFAANNGDGIAAVQHFRGCDFNEATRLIAEHLGLKNHNSSPVEKNGQTKGKIVAAYTYVDELGNLLFQVCRLDPKAFRQRKPNGKGGWTWSVKGVRSVLYHLDELSAADRGRPVVIAEGEKDADRLREIGVLATCNPGGAGKWRDEYSACLHGRAVVVLADNDAPGRKHAEQVAESLQRHGCRVKIVDIPNLPDKGDVSDWIAAGGTKNVLATLIKNAAEWQPTPVAKAEKAKPETIQPEEQPIEFAPFPVAVLPGILHLFVTTASNALGCDASYIVLPLLSSLAAAVGNVRRIKLKRSWREPCIIWTVIIGESGTLKSPALDLVLLPIQRRQAEAFKEYEEALLDYHQEMESYAAELNEWKKTGKKKGEPQPDKPQEPKPLRFLCSDTTVEALAVVLEGQPRGLLVARDELSGWINSFDSYKACRGADAAHWLSMHRGTTMLVDRKTGKRIIHVPRASVSITGGVQPKTLASALRGRYRPHGGDSEAQAEQDREHFENGLAARLLMAMPPRVSKKWTEADIPEDVERSMDALFTRILELDFDPECECV